MAKGCNGSCNLHSYACVHRSTQVVVTDGGEEFTDSALDALRLNLEKNSCNLLPPATSPTRDGDGLGDGLGATVAAAVGGAGGASSGGARVALERLTWGGHAGFLERYGVGSGGGAVEDSNGGAGGGRGKRGFDYIVAADVLCERVMSKIDVFSRMRTVEAVGRCLPLVCVGRINRMLVL